MEPFLQLTCQRCGHGWIPNVPCPIVCPACHSPYWRLPRKNGRPTPQRVIPNTFHTEPLMTGTPQVQTPQYVHVEPRPVYNVPPPPAYVQPPTFMGEQVIRTYPPPGEGLQGIDYTQPYPEPPIRFPSAPEYTEIPRDEYIVPDRDMPLPLRKCKLCGYKGYGDSYKNHNCRR
jgi:hypothetical protein